MLPFIFGGDMIYRYFDGVYTLEKPFGEIPKGFSWNGATYYPFKESYALIKATCIHDWYLYQKEFQEMIIKLEIECIYLFHK